MTISIEIAVAVLSFLLSVLAGVIRYFYNKVDLLTKKVVKLTTQNEFVKESLEAQIRDLDEELREINKEHKEFQKEMRECQKENNDKYQQLKDAMAEQTLNITSVINDNYIKILTEMQKSKAS